MTDTDTAGADIITAPGLETIATELQQVTFGRFDTAAILVGDNVRTDAEATITDEFVKSIAASKGNRVAVPLFRTPDGGLRLRWGGRRFIGCERAGVRLYAYLAGDEDDDQAARRARIIDQLQENDGRVDLKPSDTAAALLTLFDTEGMTVAGIAKALGKGRKDVTAALAMAGSAPARQAADEYGLDLPRTAVISEFEGDGDDDAVAALLAAAEREDMARFDQAAKEMRATRAERFARRAFVAGLAEQGIRVWSDDDAQYGYYGLPWNNRLTSLRTPEGAVITPEEHAACPGHRVVIAYGPYWPEEAEAAYRDEYHLAPEDEVDFADDADAEAAGVVTGWQVTEYMCADPGEHGHKNLRQLGRPEEAAASQSEAEKAEARSRAYQHVRRGNVAWRAAREVRIEKLAELCARKTPPKGTLKKLMAALARADWDLIQGMQKGNALAAKLLGVDGHDQRADLGKLAEEASDNRALVVGLAVLLGAAEAPLEDDHTWRADGEWAHNHLRKAAGPYLATLRDWLGFTLSPIETAVADGDTGWSPVPPPAAQGQIDAGTGVPPGGAQDDQDGPAAGAPADHDGPQPGPAAGDLAEDAGRAGGDPENLTR